MTNLKNLEQFSNEELKEMLSGTAKLAKASNGAESRDFLSSLVEDLAKELRLRGKNLHVQCTPESCQHGLTACPVS